MATLDLALIGNGAIGCLLNEAGEFVWGCFPRFDGDPTFCRLLQGDAPADAAGTFAVDLLDLDKVEQHYIVNSAILLTRLYDRSGGCVEITDFAPRFRQHGRMYCPTMVVRQLRAVSGNPRVRIRLRPATDWGAGPTIRTSGSNHIRFVGSTFVLRLTADVSITAILEETPFFLNDTVTLILGPDETVPGAVGEVARHLLEETLGFWREWVRNLAIPFEWQDDVIRAAITLELNVYEDTGAIIAAMTTSVPEAPNSGRNWDYRFCWLRDAYFVINALNRLGSTRTMEHYLAYILNLVAAAEDGRLQPVYGINGRKALSESTVTTLPGYRSMGPVRVGNAAYSQIQHDVYGAAILAATHVFFDRRLVQRGDAALFTRLEKLGELAALLYDKPDAGIWELRGTNRIHTFSSVMCWAGCDHLAQIATQLGLADRATYWRATADRMHDTICERAWDSKRNTFVATIDGDALDASLLRMHELGFLAADDPRFIGTVEAIERDLRRGQFIYRYVERDDFGEPENAFLVCTFWYCNALAVIGRRDEARALFDKLMSYRSRLGLLSEDIDPTSGELWGNFVQTYSMVGLIDSAMRLSVPWDRAV